MISRISSALLVSSLTGLLFACSPAATTLHERDPQAPIPQGTKAPAQEAIPEGTTAPPQEEMPKVKDGEKPVIPPEKLVWVKVNGGGQETFKPGLDILFVIDDSDSMKVHQEELAKNIGQFTAGFNKNRMIDYHIGVTSVWDSTDRAIRMRQDAHDKKGRVLFANGELRPVRDPSGKARAARYVEKYSTDNTSILAATLNIKVTPYDEGGPEVEEMFSPIMGAIDLAGHGGPNDKFFRDDAHLAVVIVSDADDSDDGNPNGSKIDPQEVANKLFALKGGDKKKVSAWGALVRKSDPDSMKDYGLKILATHDKTGAWRVYHPECFDAVNKTDKKGRVSTSYQRNSACPTGFGPERIENFIVAANPLDGTASEIRAKHIMGLTNFGRDLLRVGSEITTKVLEKEIVLDHIPRTDDKTGRRLIRVAYVTSKGQRQDIPEGSRGWVYDDSRNSIRISGSVDYKSSDAQGHFEVEMVPLNI